MKGIKDAYTNRAIEHIIENQRKNKEAFSQNVIRVPASRRWDYAIPENYTNYQDGFIVQDGEFYRWRPILNVKGKILYYWKALEFYQREDGADEVIYAFDRQGNKYTFITYDDMEGIKGGNPSYYDFLPRVKRYKK